MAELLTISWPLTRLMNDGNCVVKRSADRGPAKRRNARRRRVNRIQQAIAESTYGAYCQNTASWICSAELTVSTRPTRATRREPAVSTARSFSCPMPWMNHMG